MKLRPKSAAGFTLLEIILAVGIGVIFMGGAVVFLSTTGGDRELIQSRKMLEEEVGAAREKALETGLRQQIDYIESPEVVSTDFLGSPRAGIVDGLATIASGSHAVVYVWYDNEYGYSHQVVRIIEQLSGKKPPRFPSIL